MDCGCYCSFNSTLVQLKVFNNEAQLVGHVRFNSTLVQLKGYDTVGKYTNNISFNSTLVQLKAICFTPSIKSLEVFQFYLSSIKRFLLQKT